MKKRGVEKKTKYKVILCVVGYAMIPLFFVLLYLLMTETYEDIMQGNSGASKSVGGIINEIYNYIPRLGEFYQRIAVHFMTPQVSLGMDVVFRLITAMIASGTIYLSAVFIMGRKLKLEYKDVAICLSVLLFLMISIFSEAYTYRFSYANNYVLGLLVTVACLLPFRLKMDNNKWWNVVGCLIVGFLFGISTELAPVAFLILVMGWVIVKFFKKEIIWKDLWGKYRLQTVAVIGLIVGLVFFYVGGGIVERTGGNYGEIYDYVSPMGLLRQPMTTITRLIQHIWYNIRYLFFAVPLMGSYILVEAKLFKKGKKYLFWQVMLVAFCVLFVGATSLIAVHDDLYPRFMLPVFIAIVLATLLFVEHIIEYIKASEKVLKRYAVTTVILGGIMIVDMVPAFVSYNLLVAPKLEVIHYNPGGDLIVDPIEDTRMSPSLVFNLKQLPPFGWGAADYVTKFRLEK